MSVNSMDKVYDALVKAEEERRQRGWLPNIVGRARAAANRVKSKAANATKSKAANATKSNPANAKKNNKPNSPELKRAKAQLAHLGREPTEAELAAELKKVQRFNAMMKGSRKGGRKSRKNRKTQRNKL